MNQFDFYFDFRSPYSYLAFTQLGSLPGRARLVPISVLDLMKLVGNTPTSLTCEAKGRYVRYDLLRWAKRYNVPIAYHPDIRKIDGGMLLRMAVASASFDAFGPAVETLFFGLWRHPADLSADGCHELFREAGLPAAEIVAAANAPSTAEALKRNDAEAAQRGVFGAPTFVVGDDLYFGNDRIDFVRERMLVA